VVEVPRAAKLAAEEAAALPLLLLLKVPSLVPLRSCCWW
jgi:hypothetical protein